MSIKGLWSGIPSLDVVCLALILNLSNLWMTILHRFKVAKSLLAWIWWVISRLSWQIDMNSLLLVEASCSESGNMGLISAWCWNFLQPRPFYVALSPSMTLALLYCCTLYHSLQFSSFPLRLSSVAISRLQRFNSQYEHPTSTVWEHAPRPVPGLGHMCGPGA